MMVKEMGSAKYIVIVAGGKGERMASATPKQFMLLAGKPVLMHTLDAFYGYDSQINIILVLPQAHHETWSKLCRQHNYQTPHQVATGGETRFHSVKNALALVPENVRVGVHDGVRPLVSREVMQRCYDEAMNHPAIVPVIPIADSIRMVDEDGKNHPVSRDALRIIQTPQVFQSTVLLKSYSIEYSPLFTDDASVVESLTDIRLVAGNKENIKITTPEDLIVAEAFLATAHHV